MSSNGGLSILDLNVCNAFTKYDELALFVNRVNINNPISVICLNECWLSVQSDVSSLHLPNYDMYYQVGNCPGHTHCGLITYVHNSFKSNEININYDATGWEHLTIEISYNSPNAKKYLVSNIYRPPEKYVAELDEFITEFLYFLTLLQHRIRTSFICGDFNVNLLEISTNAHFNNYFESIISKGFFPRITLPTRIQPPSFSLIDNILCNDKIKVKYNKKKHSFSKWMTNEILQSINQKNRLYKTLVHTDTDNTDLFNRRKDEYKQYRAYLRKQIREAKRKYYDHIFSLYKNDIKNTWKILNETLNRNKRKHQSQDFLINNELVNDPDIIVNEFNAYFVNIAKNLADSIPVADHFSTYLNDPSDNTFKFDLVTERDVAYIIHNLKNKKSYGHDYLSNILLKRAQATLVKPLTFLINQTLTTGIFPRELKISRVKPLFKKGDPMLFSNYRPISLLSSISKIYEYVIFHQLLNYMDTNKLFYNDQYGFRPRHSTELAAVRFVTDLIKDMDNYKIPTTVLIDLSKAFDTLNHDILLSKLGYYGVSGVELRLLSNYLSDRVQYVEYLGAISQSRSIGVGVPQGSILGPLLFLIYINDLPNSSDMFNILMYADDTTLFCNFDTTCNSEKINSELEKLYRWLCSNKLSLNVGKTKFACFHTAQRIVAYPELKINNVIIDRVTEFNFLGLIISSNMKWKKHIDHIALKVSKITGIMYRLKFILPADVLLTIYNSLILPHFNYCHLAWGSNITAGHKLHLLQKKAVRIVDHRHFLAHTEPICKRLRIVKIVDMFQISIWKFYYKLMNNMLPSYFEYMKPVQPVACSYYGIRKPRLHPPIINHEFGEQMVQYRLIKILNEDNHETTLNKNNIYSQSFFTFKVTLKINKINSYSDTCNIRDCNICKMDQENE